MTHYHSWWTLILLIQKEAKDYCYNNDNKYKPKLLFLKVTTYKDLITDEYYIYLMNL